MLHCESIPARASLHDWTIAPHRHPNLHQFFWIEPPGDESVSESDGGAATLEGRSYELAPAAAISLPPLSVHGFHFRPGTRGWVVTLPVATLARELAEAAGLRAALARSALIRPAPSHSEESPVWIFEAVAREYAGAGLGRTKALASLAGLLATWFARALASQAAREAAAPRAGAELLARFQAQVERDYRRPRALADHARELGVTPTHLTRVSRALTGLPASQLILERRLLEARRALAYTTLQVAQIAYMLGYGDPAYFARVFTKATGESPSAFRARMTAL